MKIILKNKKTADELIDNDYDYPRRPSLPLNSLPIKQFSP